MSFKSTIVVVEDVRKSRQLYEEAFGLVVDSDFGEYNCGFVGGLALYQKKMFREMTDGVSIAERPNSFVLYFEYADVPAMERRLEERGLTFLHRTREQPWGQLALRAWDNDGHLLEVAEDMDVTLSRMFDSGMDVAAVARKTGYAEDYVRAKQAELGKA